jgi:hypothetical protein
MKSAIRIVGFLIVLAALGSFALAQGASSGVTGKGTAGQIPVWVGTHQVGNSVIRQDSDSTIVVEAALGPRRPCGSVLLRRSFCRNGHDWIARVDPRETEQTQRGPGPVT